MLQVLRQAEAELQPQNEHMALKILKVRRSLVATVYRDDSSSGSNQQLLSGVDMLLCHIAAQAVHCACLELIEALVTICNNCRSGLLCSVASS